MSIDRSLRVGGGLTRHRNVLTRAERITKLAGGGKFDQQAGCPLGLPKVANRKVVAKTEKKVKAEAVPGAEGAAGAAAAPAAAPAAAAAPGKGAAAKPAAGGKAGKGK
ncbi:MAG: small basic protein [Phycisphaeraceae bacterium]|nr:small basic protein [Phycisphaeraceae bacterium]